jgi:hypothetical protein
MHDLEAYNPSMKRSSSPTRRDSPSYMSREGSVKKQRNGPPCFYFNKGILEGGSGCGFCRFEHYCGVCGSDDHGMSSVYLMKFKRLVGMSLSELLRIFLERSMLSWKSLPIPPCLHALS